MSDRSEYYIVSYADYCGEDVFEEGAYLWRPSFDIDTVNAKEKEFADYKEAMAYINSEWERRKDDEWLAYMRISKCVEELVKSFK